MESYQPCILPFVHFRQKAVVDDEGTTRYELMVDSERTCRMIIGMECFPIEKRLETPISLLYLLIYMQSEVCLLACLLFHGSYLTFYLLAAACQYEIFIRFGFGLFQESVVWELSEGQCHHTRVWRWDIGSGWYFQRRRAGSNSSPARSHWNANDWFIVVLLISWWWCTTPKLTVSLH